MIILTPQLITPYQSMLGRPKVKTHNLTRGKFLDLLPIFEINKVYYKGFIYPSKHPLPHKGTLCFGLDLILPLAECFWLSAVGSLNRAGGGRCKWPWRLKGKEIITQTDWERVERFTVFILDMDARKRLLRPSVMKKQLANPFAKVKLDGIYLNSECVKP